MANKVMKLDEAVRINVKAGDLLFIGGAIHGTPSAAISEIVRQRINHLTVVAILSNTMPLIGEGLVDRLLTAYAMTDERRSYALRRAREKFNVTVEFKEYSHFDLAAALIAGHMGIPFMPTRSHLGSDMMKYNENIQSIDCPFERWENRYCQGNRPGRGGDPCAAGATRKEMPRNGGRWVSISRVSMPVSGLSSPRRKSWTAK